ncbi:hypothetical protein EYF80_030018 [Liparis tanakae]|uniref:Uncharacterized protein n=1 Tax=Liparis tanakae TaxID=230148 RepID=A0A4Z2H370_9TELE|nr:hypothetical protein EYF80_030018 [Liparis tanakae]
MRLAVGHSGPRRVVVVVKENIHLIRRQELRRGLHVVVSQAVVMRVRVLPVQHGVVVHPAGLISRHIHRGGFCVSRALEVTNIQGEDGLTRASCILKGAHAALQLNKTLFDTSSLQRQSSQAPLPTPAPVLGWMGAATSMSLQGGCVQSGDASEDSSATYSDSRGSKLREPMFVLTNGGPKRP